MAEEHGITGNWRGHYTYASQPDEGSNFDAIFVESEGSLKGNIRDESMLGEAVLDGTFAYPNVSFTKTYYTRGMSPIRYTGTMSGDGKTITGRWRIEVPNTTMEVKGTWMAHRTDKDEKKKETKEETQGHDMEKVR
ncbi:MAG: hypothetical protein SGJ27_10855 [Candidatus Melainabacteria bacterium]|nr:hypothetical protein [Candidatus Melainabacteria bacterium]